MRCRLLLCRGLDFRYRCLVSGWKVRRDDGSHIEHMLGQLRAWFLLSCRLDVGVSWREKLPGWVILGRRRDNCCLHALPRRLVRHVDGTLVEQLHGAVPGGLLVRGRRSRTGSVRRGFLLGPRVDEQRC